MKFLDLIFAARPMLHLPIWSVYLVSLHYHNVLAHERVDGRDLLVLAGLSLLAAGAYYLNQVFDEESDRLNNKLGFLSGRLLTQRCLMLGYLTASLAGLIIGWFVAGVTFGIFIQIFLLGFLYSAPPFRLKDRPIWGLLANAWGVGFLVAFSVMPNVNFHNAGLLGWDNPYFFAAAIGGIYVLTTIPDRKGDRLTGKKTLAVVTGESGSVALATLLLMTAAFLAVRDGYLLLGGIASCSSALSGLALFARHPRILMAAIKLPILLLVLLAGHFYPLYLVFILVLLLATRLYYRRRFGIIYPSLTK